MNLFDAKPVETDTCKGLVFRYLVTKHHTSRGGWKESTEYALQKKLSCKGCMHCADLIQSLPDFEGPAVQEPLSHNDLVTMYWYVSPQDHEGESDVEIHVRKYIEPTESK